MDSIFDYGFNGWRDILKDKDTLTDMYIRYMANRSVKMFEYTGLPSTIAAKDLEHILQAHGFAIIVKTTSIKGEEGLYAVYGGLGGELNAYYLPTLATVSNPYLRYSNSNLKIDKDCVVMLSDSTYTGLMPMFTKYAQLLAESDISIRFALINSRVQAIIYADNDTSKNDAVKFLDDIEEGKKIGVIGGSSFFKGVQTQGYSSGSSTNIKDIMELQQYIRSQWYIDLGLDANYNMKRESLNDGEIGMNDDILLPLIDDMLEQRELGVKRINEMFGTNISVKLSSSWQKIRKDVELSNELIEDEVVDEPIKEGDSDEAQ